MGAHEVGVNAPRQPRQGHNIISASLVVLLAILVVLVIAGIWMIIMVLGMVVLWALGGPDG